METNNIYYKQLMIQNSNVVKAEVLKLLIA